MVRTITLATLVAGTLDILAATILSLIFGREPAAMLRGVASGPFPQATEWGAAGSWLGLLVHFTLMAIMVTVFVVIARRHSAMLDRPLRSGIGYGLVTYVVMNLIVVPLRFGTFPPKPISIATQLFCHIVLVGIPIALIAARNLRARTSG
jgi:uncharacterized membrane protein YagU involved in acid resistance